MTNDWIYVDNIKIEDDVMAIHCDTRDFHCLLTNEPLKNDKEKYWNLQKALDNKKFLIDASEVQVFLKRLETISGGPKDWRFLSFKNLSYKQDTWLKYVRLYRVENNRFIVTFNGEKAIHVADMVQENINKNEL